MIVEIGPNLASAAFGALFCATAATVAIVAIVQYARYKHAELGCDDNNQAPTDTYKDSGDKVFEPSIVTYPDPPIIA